MGFLMGAYGKLLAASRVRSIQSRLMNVQSQMRRAARESANMQKYINNQKTQMMNMFKQQSAYAQMGLQAEVQGGLAAKQQELLGKFFENGDINGKMLENYDKEAYSQAQAQYNTISINANTDMSQKLQALNMTTAHPLRLAMLKLQ